MTDQQPSTPYLIVGLGNPGREYRESRHNIGFLVLSHLAERLGVSFSRLQSKALVTDGRYQDHKIILAKPQTFMNLSGQAVGPLVNFYKIPLENLLVVYDEVDLPFGTLRLRPSGGSGGHNGMKSLITRLGTEGFPRLRLGVSRPPGRMEAAAYVLQDFSAEEAALLPEILDLAGDAALTFITQGIEAAMNRYNGDALDGEE
jgi:PTH1 family peptidyl-tRNA hydrolase